MQQLLKMYLYRFHTKWNLIQNLWIRHRLKNDKKETIFCFIFAPTAEAFGTFPQLIIGIKPVYSMVFTYSHGLKVPDCPQKTVIHLPLNQKSNDCIFLYFPWFVFVLFLCSVRRSRLLALRLQRDLKLDLFDHSGPAVPPSNTDHTSKTSHRGSPHGLCTSHQYRIDIN